MPTDPPILRHGVPEDAAAVADLYLHVRQENVSSIPPGIHPPDEVHAWMQHVVFTQHDVWVAEDHGVPVGFMVLTPPDWIDHLYVDGAHAGQGLGTRFLERAKNELAGPIQLWTFQSNEGARRFYERNGFVAVHTTEGDNEEGAPDVCYQFTPDP